MGKADLMISIWASQQPVEPVSHRLYLRGETKRPPLLVVSYSHLSVIYIGVPGNKEIVFSQ